MKLTTKSEYTILALLYLARQPENEFIKIEQICESCGISKKYLELLFSTLRQNHFIKTMRGRDGGYRLSKPPCQITIAEIIRLMDGALAPTESVSKYFYAKTPLSKEKKVLNVLREIRDFISDKLENLTVSDLI